MKILRKKSDIVTKQQRGRRKVKVELTPKQLLGKQSKIKGYINENRSIAYILANPDVYGVTDRVYIYCTPRLGNRHTPDLFSVKYYENTNVLKFAGWDIVALGKDKVTLVQVKSTRKPSRRYMEALHDFGVHLENINKELHVWDDLGVAPQIINLKEKVI